VAPKTKPIITAADVAALFRDVGAPAPSAESLPYVIVTMRNIAAHYRPKPRQKRTAQDRAQDAVDELHRVLPAIIKDTSTELTNFQEFHQKQVQHAQTVSQDKVLAESIAHIAANRVSDLEEKLAAYRRIFNSLCNFDLASPRPGDAEIWHADAKLLLDIYRSVVGEDAGASRVGPAVRFIQSALKLCGKNVSPGAIEVALARIHAKGTTTGQ
jgi:hypothetical protein